MEKIRRDGICIKGKEQEVWVMIQPMPASHCLSRMHYICLLGKEYLASANMLFSAVVKEHFMAFYRLSV